MSSSNDDRLVEFVLNAPRRAIDSIATGLRSGQLTLGSSAFAFLKLAYVDDVIAMRAAKLFRDLDPALSANSLATLLAVAGSVREAEKTESPAIEIAWTGPDVAAKAVRPTATVVQEMLAGARQTGEILLVGYSLTVPSGSLMEAVLGLIIRAAKTYTKVVIVLDSLDDSHQKDRFLEKWDPTAKKPAIYTWKGDPTSPYSKMHAKCLVIDRSDALVSSANFTYHGLESNIELGLRVRGNSAGVIAERFDNLISDGSLALWE